MPHVRTIVATRRDAGLTPAVAALVALAPDPEPLRAELEPLLADRTRAAYACAGIPAVPAVAPLVPWLVALADEPERGLEWLVVDTLARVAPALDASTRAELAETAARRLATTPHAGWLRVLEALGGDAVPAIRAHLLRHGHPATAPALDAIGRAAPQALLGLHADATGDETLAVLAAIARVDGAEEDRLPVLRRALADADPATRSWLLQGLGRMGRTAAPFVCAELRQALRDGSPADELLGAVRAIGDPADGVVPDLLRAFADPELDADHVAHTLAALGSRGIDALEGLHAAGEEVADAIAAGLAARGPRARMAAARAVLRLELRTEGLVELLQRCVGDPDRQVAKWAALALCALETDRADRGIVRRLAWHDDPQLRARAIPLFGHLPPEPIDLAILVAALDDLDAGVHAAAARALGAIGPAAVSAQRALRERLEDEDHAARASALEALRRLR